MAKALQYGAERTYQSDEVPKPLEIIENISYIEDDTESHKLDIIYPKTKKDSYPFIINIHGGGFSMNSKDKLYRNYGMRLAGDQFAVVNINFRLSVNSPYPAQLEDVLSVISFLYYHAKEYHLNLDQMFLAGDSSGAYMSAMTACILQHPRLREYYGFDLNLKVRAVAANCGMFDFTTMMNPDVHFPMKRMIVEMLFGTKSFMELPVYQYSSVVDYVTEDFPPIYLCDTEKSSFAAEAYRLEKVLKSKNIQYQLHIFSKKENLMHAFNIMSKYPQSKQVLDEIFAFFGAQMK